ncbi:UNVERIFIED_CONTAM: hypothetical protein FKN15_047099 [Acipenser sinensis]
MMMMLEKSFVGKYFRINVIDNKGVLVSLSPRLAAQCGYSLTVDFLGNAKFLASVLSCFAQNTATAADNSIWKIVFNLPANTKKAMTVAQAMTNGYGINTTSTRILVRAAYNSTESQPRVSHVLDNTYVISYSTEPMLEHTWQDGPEKTKVTPPDTRTYILPLTYLLAGSVRTECQGSVMMMMLDKSFVGKYFRINVIDCFTNGTMAALAVKVESVPSLSPSQLTLRDLSCRPLLSDAINAVFYFNVNSCGTTRRFDNNILTYENEVLFTSYRLRVACHYLVNDTKVVQFLYQNNPAPVVQPGLEDLAVIMRLALDEYLTIFHPVSSNARVLSPSHLKRFEVKMFSFTSGQDALKGQSHVLDNTYVISYSIEPMLEHTWQDGPEKTKYTVLHPITTPFMPRPPVVTNNTVPKARVFNVTLGTFLPDVELVKIIVGPETLTVPEANLKGYNVQEHVFPNGSKTYTLQVPFEDPNVKQKVTPPDTRTYILPLTYLLNIVPENTPFTHPAVVEAILKDINCFTNGTMAALAVKVESVPSLSPSQLTLRDPSCRPLQSDATNAVFYFNVNSCGTTRRFDNNLLTYENEVLFTSYRLRVACHYLVNDTKVVQFLYQNNPAPVVQPGLGDLAVIMRLALGLPYPGESQGIKMESVYIKQEEVQKSVPICIKQDMPGLEPVHIKQEETELEPVHIKQEETELEAVHIKKEETELLSVHIKQGETELLSVHIKQKETELEPVHIKQKEAELLSVHIKQEETEQ